MRSHPRPPLAATVERARLADRRTRECVRTQQRLGIGHPLSLVLWAASRTLDQLFVVAAVQLAAGGLTVEGQSSGPALLIAASLVQACLGFRLLLLAESRRVACLNLLVAGCPPGAVPALAREWRRLADPRARAALAGSLEDLAASSGSRPYFSVRVIRAVTPELRELAELVRDDAAPAPGVAFVERLLRYGSSPLYGHAIEPLRVELARARFLLLRDG
jgi:hypothetical protein